MMSHIPTAKPPTTKPGDYGPTGLCDEAQADGVPCDELDRDCETCGRAPLQDEADTKPS